MLVFLSERHADVARQERSSPTVRLALPPLPPLHVSRHPPRLLSRPTRRATSTFTAPAEPARALERERGRECARARAVGASPAAPFLCARRARNGRSPTGGHTRKQASTAGARRGTHGTRGTRRPSTRAAGVPRSWDLSARCGVHEHGHERARGGGHQRDTAGVLDRSPVAFARRVTVPSLYHSSRP